MPVPIPILSLSQSWDWCHSQLSSSQTWPHPNPNPAPSQDWSFMTVPIPFLSPSQSQSCPHPNPSPIPGLVSFMAGPIPGLVSLQAIFRIIPYFKMGVKSLIDTQLPRGIYTERRIWDLFPPLSSLTEAGRAFPAGGGGENLPNSLGTSPGTHPECSPLFIGGKSPQFPKNIPRDSSQTSSCVYRGKIPPVPWEHPQGFIPNPLSGL